MWLKWLPWKFAVSRIARAHGFLDPIALQARLQSFTQPSEVAEPIELLRAGVVLHARGLVNSRVIQHNLDWVWPYWIERQFDPMDDAFVPRAFSITHINLTHRNWTALGLPDNDELPIVDPRGLLTPLLDKWSLDSWIVTEDGNYLLPSKSATTAQQLILNENDLAIKTATSQNGCSLISTADVQLESSLPVCRMKIEALADRPAWVAVVLRPYNPEGISFIHEVNLSSDHRHWHIDKECSVEFSTPAERYHVSDYRAGDVFIHMHDLGNEETGKCDVGMVTAAALFRLEANQPREIIVKVPLGAKTKKTPAPIASWQEELAGHCQLQIPNQQFQFLYDAAIRTLILHSPDDVYPGPYTYKRFWFRDAAFIIHGLLCAGLIKRAERALDRFPSRQTARGYFHSQDGEWDSNGQVLWIMHRFCELTGKPPKHDWRRPILRGGRWIYKKRLPDNTSALHAGLMPAGFSAEHLGPNDYYYWDDFWGIAGLEAASALAQTYGEEEEAKSFQHEAEKFSQAVDCSLERVAERLGHSAIPASPYRRMDAGAIGSVVCGYPLLLVSPDDQRLLATVEFLLANNFVKGGFFQDMIHSGINAYLTLHVAQILLRAGDPRYFDLMQSVAEIASPTGQWPEAIHPRTRGGCMGDGQHVWAAVEWVLMIRNCFVREEGDRLILASGIPQHWLVDSESNSKPKPLSFGSAPTSFGNITLSIQPQHDKVVIAWQAVWHDERPIIEVRLPGFDDVVVQPDQDVIELLRGANT